MSIIDVAELKLGARLGEGYGGTVYTAMHEGVPYAVKKSINSIGFGLHEAQILDSLDHKNIVMLMWSAMHDEYTYNVYPLYTTDMFNYVRDNTSHTEAHYCRLLLGIASALKYMHARNVMHRDVKLENIMYDESTDECILIDFDFAVCTTVPLYLECGTRLYRAPEIWRPEYNRNGYMHSVDVYSFGVCLYTAVCGHSPAFATTGGIRTIYWYECCIPRTTSTFRELVTSMCASDPTARPDWDHVMSVMFKCANVNDGTDVPN